MKKKYLKPVSGILADDMEMDLLAGSVTTTGLGDELIQEQTPGNSWNDAMGRDYEFDE
jgi:hypothetical protein